MRDRLFPAGRPADAFEEWRRVSAGRLCDYSGITYDRIDACGGVQWPVPATTRLCRSVACPLYAEGDFPNPTGRVRLPAWTCSAREPPRRDFPFLLNTGRTVEHWHTRTKTGRVTLLESLAPEAWVEINPADADALSAHGDIVRVVLPPRRGRADRGPGDPIVSAGEVFIPFHYDEACANRLTVDEFDPISREPNYKQCAVRLEKLVPSEIRYVTA